jgi:hypothetical protein
LNVESEHFDKWGEFGLNSSFCHKIYTYDCVCIHINTCIHACMPACFGLEKWLNCFFQIFKEIHNMKVYIHMMLSGGKPLVILPSKINAHEKVNHCKIYTRISVYLSVFCTIFPWNWNGIAYKKKIYIIWALRKNPKWSKPERKNPEPKNPNLFIGI